MSEGKFVCAFLAILIFLTGLVSRPAHAEISYRYVTDKTEYFTLPGGTVNVNIYLKETLTGGSTSFIASDGGLNQFGVDIKQVPSGTPLQPAPFIKSESPNTVDFPKFAFPTLFWDQYGTMTGSIPLGPVPGILPGNTGGGASPSISGEIFLGSITIGVPNNFNYATFTVGAVDPLNGGYTVTKNNTYDMDSAINDETDAPTNLFTGVGDSVSTFTVNFPEPGALGAFVCCGGLLAVRRRRAAACTSKT